MQDFKNFVKTESSEYVDSKDIKMNLEEVEPAFVKNTANSESSEYVDSKDIKMNLEEMKPAFVKNTGNSESSKCVDSKDIKINLQEIKPAFVKNTDNSKSFACVSSKDIRIKQEYEENARTSMDAGISEENANLCKDCSKICYLKDLNEKFVCRECCPSENINSDLEDSNSAEESESYKNIEIIKVEEPTISNVAITHQAVPKHDFKANKQNVDKHFKKLNDSSYICLICPEELRRTCKTKFIVRKHIQIRHFGYKYECTECNSKYTSRPSIRYHYKIKHGKKDCINIILKKDGLGNCEMEDYTKLDVDEYIKKLGDSYSCALCPELKCMQYRAIHAVRRHIRIIHYGHRYACPDCNEKYFTSATVKSHYKKVHGTKDAAIFRVNLTGGYKLLNISHELLKEPRNSMPKELNAEKVSAFIKKVKNIFICTLCPKGKSLHHKSVPSARSHIRYIHYGYGYKCTECSKKYALRKDLKNHYTIQHHTEAPTTIKLTRSFEPSERSNKSKKQIREPSVRSNKSKKQIREPSVQSNEIKNQIRKIGKHYICAVCPKTKAMKYKSITGIRRHVKVKHHGYRYECSECGAKYKQPPTIKKHYRDAHNREGDIYLILTKHFRHCLPTKQQQADNKFEKSLSSQTGYMRKKLKCKGFYYFCTLCSTEEDKSQKYKQLKTIERHIKIRHQRYRFHCTECSHKYSNLNTLKKHYKKKHKIEAPTNIALTKTDGEDIEAELSKMGF